MEETMIFDGIRKRVTPPHCECPDNKEWVLIYEHRGELRVQAQWAPVGEKATKIANELGMILECEILSTGEISLYCHLPEEENYGCSLAENSPGEKEPGKVLQKMILDKATNIVSPQE